MAKSGIQSFRDLVVWQKAMALVETVYRVTAAFPPDERFGLTSQMRRAAVSIASNIAEGHARNTRGEYVQFLGHARGSLAELETQTILARRLGFTQSNEEQLVVNQLDDVGRLLTALKSSLTTSGASS